MKMLQGLGLNPNLLRISVGVEPIQEIIADFQQALE
jgi:cystathionine beta-lyase/cystathionine gamma-synthase